MVVTITLLVTAVLLADTLVVTTLELRVLVTGTVSFIWAIQTVSLPVAVLSPWNTLIIGTGEELGSTVFMVWKVADTLWHVNDMGDSLLCYQKLLLFKEAECSTNYPSDLPLNMNFIHKLYHLVKVKSKYFRFKIWIFFLIFLQSSSWKGN